MALDDWPGTGCQEARSRPGSMHGRDAMLYTVGFRVGEASEHVTLEAEDALEAAKYVKSEHPTASITYSRAANHEERGTEEVSASGP